MRGCHTRSRSIAEWQPKGKGKEGGEEGGLRWGGEDRDKGGGMEAGVPWPGAAAAAAQLTASPSSGILAQHTPPPPPTPHPPHTHCLAPGLALLAVKKEGVAPTLPAWFLPTPTAPPAPLHLRPHSRTSRAYRQSMKRWVDGGTREGRGGQRRHKGGHKGGLWEGRACEPAF